MAKVTQIHFPLSFLRILPELYPGTSIEARKRRVSALIRWGIVEKARRQWSEQLAAFQAVIPCSDQEAAADLAKWDRAEIAGFVEAGTLPYYHQSGLQAATAVFSAFNVILGDGSHTLTAEQWRADCDIYEQLAALVPAKDAWVHMHRHIIRSYELGDMKWDLFALCSAVASKFGFRRRKPMVIRYAELIARSSGYKSTREMPPGTTPLLTQDQIRWRIPILEKRGLVGAGSLEHTRDQWFWLPYRCPDGEVKVARAIAEKVSARDRKKAQRERLASLAETFRSEPPRVTRPPYNPPSPDGPGSDDGGLPKAPTPKPTPVVQKPTVGIDGVLSADGCQWYTRAHLEKSLSDSPELLQRILSEFQRWEFEGVTFYSVNRKLAPA